MSPAIKKRLLRTACLAAAAFIVGAGIALVQIKSTPLSAPESSAPAKTVPGVSVGGDFTLVDHTGETVTQNNYAGQYKLIYFGFTYCPAICPTELRKISMVMNTLEKTAPDTAEKMQPLFISIDPERDTPDVMKDYITLFHPALIGLTGSPEQVKTVLKDYRVYASKVQEEDMSDYTMDHSSYIYLMSPENDLLSIYRIEDNAEYVVRDIQATVK